MDIDREFREADFRIKMQIRRSALIAEAKIYGMTPEAYAEKLDREAAAKRAEDAAEAGRQIGRAYGEMARALQDAAANIAEGFRQAFSK